MQNLLFEEKPQKRSVQADFVQGVAGFQFNRDSDRVNYNKSARFNYHSLPADEQLEEQAVDAEHFKQFIKKRRSQRNHEGVFPSTNSRDLLCSLFLSCLRAFQREVRSHFGCLSCQIEKIKHKYIILTFINQSLIESDYYHG